MRFRRTKKPVDLGTIRPGTRFRWDSQTWVVLGMSRDDVGHLRLNLLNEVDHRVWFWQ